MSASLLRRLLCTAALAGGLLVLGGGAANATDLVPDGDAPLTQTQDVTNTNTTDQDATANAETTHPGQRERADRDPESGSEQL